MAKDYSQLNKDELLKLIEKFEARKKFGLIWDEERTKEKFEKDAEGGLPILKELRTKEIPDETSDSPNILIEGDNYHVLSVLNFTHSGKIDAIYIDPPYNTGAKDWKYNNDYVDANDTYRHSKWLSFMKKRLLLSKNLLSEDGIICVTIDDYEMSRLSILMEEIFGEENHLGTVVIRNNPSGRSTERGFSIAHEYAIFYSKSARVKIGRLERNESQISRYKEKDKQGAFEWVNFRKHGATRQESPKMYYPIFLTQKSIRIPDVKWNNKKQEWDLLEKPKRGETIVFPIDDDGFDRRWKWGIERAKNEVGQMKVGLDRSKKLAVYIKSRMNDEGMLPLTWWDKKEYSATSYGTNLLKDIFSDLQVFAYPKSIYAVKDCLRVLSEKKDAVFLDYFAGSGTTGHAVLELNKEDGGSRRFILCTNNENKICEDVTYPRLKKIISGYTSRSKVKVGGLGGSLRYFKTSFVKKSLAKDDLKIRLTNECAGMLCLREGVFDELKSTSDYKIFKQNEKILAIYYSLECDALKNLKKELDKLEGQKILYCFTLDPLGLSKSDFTGWNDVVLESIPQKILDVYKQIYEY